MPPVCLRDHNRARHLAVPQGSKRQQAALLLAEQLCRNTVRRAVHPHVGRIAQPFTHLNVGRRRIHLETERAQPAVQRNPETVAQVMDEAFDLALRLRPVRATQPRQKAVVVGKVAEPGLQPVLARAIRVTADHHGAHVVVKHLVGVPPMNANAASWHAINVSSRSSVTNCT